jgi:hypothetical protein
LVRTSLPKMKIEEKREGTSTLFCRREGGVMRYTANR